MLPRVRGFDSPARAKRGEGAAASLPRLLPRVARRRPVGRPVPLREDRVLAILDGVGDAAEDSKVRVAAVRLEKVQVVWADAGDDQLHAVLLAQAPKLAQQRRSGLVDALHVRKVEDEESRVAGWPRVAPVSAPAAAIIAIAAAVAAAAGAAAARGARLGRTTRLYRARGVERPQERRAGRSGKRGACCRSAAPSGGTTTRCRYLTSLTAGPSKR